MYQRNRTIRNACLMATGLIALFVAQANAVPGQDPEKCRRDVALASAKFERDKINRLKKCQDFVQNGKTAMQISDCFADATDKIELAADKLLDKIAASCCGQNKICNLADTLNNADVTLTNMEWDNRAKVCGTGNRAGLVCSVSNPDCPGQCIGGTEAGRDCFTTAIACGGGGVCTGGNDCALPVAGPSWCPTLESGKLPNYTAPEGGPIMSGLACGTCRFGTDNGQVCRADADCGGTACFNGANNGLPCTIPTDCPGGSCRSGLCLPGIQLDSPDDVANCLLCFGEASVDQIDALSWDNLHPFNPTTGSTAAKLKLCKRTIGKETRLFYDKKRNFLRLCEDKLIRGLIPGPCPDGSIMDVTTTAGKIEAARLKLIKQIADPATGKCRTFNLSQIGAPLTCPGVVTPGGSPACGGAIDDPTDLANCLACLVEYKVDCADALATTLENPATNELPAECNGTCGNGKVDPGESCDDGNVVDGDSCPSDCTVASCATTGTTLATVNFTRPTTLATAPAPIDVSGMTLYVTYPDSKVRIPGQGSETPVQDAINVPSGATFTPNDLNYALNILINQPDLSAIAEPVAMEITFQTCTGATPLDGDFHCRVVDTADTSGTTVYGGTCTVDVP